jgi:alkylated DNA repair dioxygenase AlkB
MSGNLPEGFVLTPDFVEPEEERALIEFVRALQFGNVRMHGVTAKRRVAQFGWHYSFESYRLTQAAPLPEALQPVRERAAAVAHVEPGEFSETLVTEYPPGAGIGWHRDAPQFGIVAGISLGAACRMRFQRGEGLERMTAAAELPARSIYLLTGSARKEWQHMIPPVKGTRWSITFRTLRSGGAGKRS